MRKKVQHRRIREYLFLSVFLHITFGSTVYAATDPALSSVMNVVFVTDEPIRERIFLAHQQSRVVTGRVIGEDGEGLPGVSIVVKGTSQGTATDVDGKYSISVPDNATALIFSFIGYQTREETISARSVIDITLTPDVSKLDEVTVVAFGIQKKESVISSITTVKPEELKMPSSNLTTALAGRLAGLISYQRSGEPGRDNAEFFIRGATTFGYKRNPLILIDNIEYTTTDLARLQPDDIQEFSILKDAAASALYGARGANGVILITTKGGKVGKPKVNIRAEVSASSPTRDVALADPVTYMKLHNEAVVTRDPLGAIIYPQSQIDNTIKGTNPVVFPSVDWHEELFKPYTVNQRFNGSLSGGGEIATYYVSGTYNQDNGILKVDRRNNFNSNISLKNFSLRSNVDINIAKTSKLTVRLYGNFDDYRGPIDGGAQVYRNVMRTPQTRYLPYYEPIESSGYVNHIMFGNTMEGGALNPYADMVKGYKEYSRSLMLAQLELRQDLSFLTEGLSLNGMMNTNRRAYFDVSRKYTPFWYAVSGYDKVSNTYQLTGLNQGPPEEGGGTDWLDFVPGEETVSSAFHLQTALNYTRTFNQRHNVSGMAIVVMRSELAGDADNLHESLPRRNMGLSGRATYNYDSRYFFEFNFGYNGSERFHKSERYGFFPSAGVAWAISNEKFFQPFLSTINRLRIRGNIGLAGNDEIGNTSERFFYLSEVNMNEGGYGASFGTDGGYSRNGFSINRYANPGITWETTRNSTFGLEFGLWDKLDVIAEYFMDHRYNILMTRASIPQTMGLQAIPKANVGEVKSRSSEIQVTYDESIGNNFIIQLRANATYSRNRYEAFEEPDYDHPWLYKKGHSTSQQWGYIAERLFVDEEEVRSSPTQIFDGHITMGGDIKFRDINGDGEINPLDRVPIGHPTTPEIIYGFGPAIRYKNFDFNFFMQGSARSSFWIDAQATAPFISYVYENETIPAGVNPASFQNQLLKVYADNHWSEENRDLYALWPRLSVTNNGNNDEKSTWFMRNGAFLRLKSIEAGYSFPRYLTERLHMETLRLYVSATNLLTISKFKLWDVEMGENGMGYPIQRVINLGLDLRF